MQKMSRGMPYGMQWRGMSTTVSSYISPSYISAGAWWFTGRVGAYRSKGRGFDSRSSCHVGTLGKSFTRACTGGA